MALNPNIILSGMPQPFDTNALLQQQISGMENINALERQRRADELAMQDRAAAAEKEAAQAQEAATLKALLPAYTYGIQTGDMAGALNLVPPEMQENLRPYVDALAGKPPQEVQAALIGSLSSSPMGQEALAAIQRAGTLGVQQGQLTLSQQQFAAEQEAAAAAAARGPEPDYEKVVLQDGTLGLLDKKSGRIKRPIMDAPIDNALPPDETVGQPIKLETEETKQQAKERAKLDAAFPKAKRGFTSAVTALDQDIADVRKLLADTVGIEAITGTFNAMTPDIMRDATRAAALYDKITAGAAFTALSDLKAASPTGGALGNVSNEEGRRLKDSVATFSRKQAPPDFIEGLERYLVDLEMARENVLSAFDETYGYRGDVNAETAAEEIKTRRGRIEEETLPQRKTNLPPGVTIKKRN
jgi:hypothetical protein